MATTNFGKTNEGADVTMYTLKNATGMEVDIITLGAALRSIRIPDKDGKVTLTFDYVKGWVMNGEQPLRFEMAGADGKDTVRVPVSVGVSDGVYCEITEGLKPGDTVLCRLDQAGRHFGMRIQEEIREV